VSGGLSAGGRSRHPPENARPALTNGSVGLVFCGPIEPTESTDIFGRPARVLWVEAVSVPKFCRGPSLLSPVPTPGLRRSGVVGQGWNVGHMCWPSDYPGVDRVPTAVVSSKPAEGSIASMP
jgi:hypothetical protein